MEPTALRGEGRAAAVEHRRGPTVLVVDDDRMSVLMIARVASALGCHCITARSGATAWREFVRTRFDLVVSDLNMPGGDGAVLARRIRGRSNVPVLLVTALDAATPAACGVGGLEGVDVLRKPMVPPQLREAIEQRLENSLPAVLEAA